MKVEINDDVASKGIYEGFIGLCLDNEGDVLMFGRHHAICLNTETFHSDGNDSVIKTYGPFTKFNGSVTLEND